MAANDAIQAFLQVMANLHTLSATNAAEHVASELLALRTRDKDSGTVICRLTEENAMLIQECTAATGQKRTLDNMVKDLREGMSQLKKDYSEINRVAEERGQRLRDESAKVALLEQHRVNLERGSKDEMYVRGLHLVKA